MPDRRQRSHLPRNRFDRLEWAGAFGDLGTLIPFVVGYISILKMDAFGILLAFGLALVVCGVYYRTPFPVQPMKAIGAVAIAQSAAAVAMTPGTILAASLATGVFWLLLGLSGLTTHITRLVPRPVILGIVFGLGMSFMLTGVKMMSTHWLIAVTGLSGAVLFLNNLRIPAMFVLLAFGIGCGIVLRPETLHTLATTPPELRLPHLELAGITWNELVCGVLFLAIPQLPLTLGNAIIAIRDENNRLFPDRQVTDKGMAISTGILNLGSGLAGGVPMCHGAGGLAGHVAFGARTGGAPIILGSLLLILALFFSDSIATLFRLFPEAILGVILFLTGAQLALGSSKFSENNQERFIALVTIGFALWNVGAAFLVGMTLALLARRGWLRV